LAVLAKRNPDFRVVFPWYGDWLLAASYLPLAKSNGFIKLGSRRVENRFKKLGLL